MNTDRTSPPSFDQLRRGEQQAIYRELRVSSAAVRKVALKVLVLRAVVLFALLFFFGQWAIERFGMVCVVFFIAITFVLDEVIWRTLEKPVAAREWP